MTEFACLIERELGKAVISGSLPMQPGDVPETYADVAALDRAVGFRPKTPIAEGVRRFLTRYGAYQAR